MKIAYLILAKDASQTARVVHRLNSDNSLFFIHVNADQPTEDFRRALADIPSNRLRWVKQEAVRWETISVIQATLNGLRMFLEDPQKPDYIVFLSGYCYPIANVKTINEFLFARHDKILLHHHPLRDEEKERIERYHFSSGRVFPPTEWPTGLKGKLLHKFQSLRYPLPRKFPSYVTPFSGSPTWGFPRSAVEYIFTFLNQHPDYLTFHEHTKIPEEMFFQTIFFNADDQIKNSVVRNDLHYVDWFKPNVPLPAVLDADDMGAIMNSKQLFARKIIDNKLMDLIDQKVDSND